MTNKHDTPAVPKATYLKAHRPWFLWTVLTILINLCIVAAAYFWLFKGNTAPTQATNQPSQATNLPVLATLSDEELNGETSDTELDTNDNNQLSPTSSNSADTLGLPLPSQSSGETASSAIKTNHSANATTPQDNTTPIIPDNQRTPTYEPANTQNNQPPKEQVSTDPIINQQTAGGRDLIAATNEADKENDTLREYIEQARQLNDQKIAQTRGYNPNPSSNQNPHLTPTVDKAQLSNDDIPSNENNQ